MRATDHGLPRRLSSTTTLLITVLDVNDNPPVFGSRAYFASVPEDAALNTDVVRVFAASKDSGVNAQITYSLVGGNQQRKFKIDSKSGVISVASHLDYEKSTGYLLTLQARDGGDPPLSQHATVNITVVDVNDNRPIFTQTTYTCLISEAATIGTEVVKVKLSENDNEFQQAVQICK